jgi:plasmid stabilization system protein ParE
LNATLANFRAVRRNYDAEGDVRAIAFGSFPYRLFYKEGVGTIEVLTIRHTSRSLGEDCYRTADALGF